MGLCWKIGAKMNNSSLILKYLKDQCKSDLPIHILRQFEKFEKQLTKEMKFYDKTLSKFGAYCMKSFTTIELFCLSLMSEKYPNAWNCNADLKKKFDHDIAFSDKKTVQSWMYFNFPVGVNGECIADLALKHLPNRIANELSPFVNAMINSRLGLYEIIKDKKDSCQMKELFTKNEIVLNQTLGGAPKGALELVRVFNIREKNYAFGNSSEFPFDKKETIINMVKEKMNLYFPSNDEIESYTTMMRLAGPYWFSVTSSDFDSAILNPNYYLKYYNNTNTL